jgi:hypothetical protein
MVLMAESLLARCGFCVRLRRPWRGNQVPVHQRVPPVRPVQAEDPHGKGIARHDTIVSVVKLVQAADLHHGDGT